MSSAVGSRVVGSRAVGSGAVGSGRHVGYTRGAVSEPRAQSSRRRAALGALLVAVVAAGLFAPALSHEFVDYDDQYFLTLNPAYNPPTFAAVARYWWRPLRSLYQPVPYTLWGLIAAGAQRSPDAAGVRLDPAPFHAANLIAHAAAAAAVFLILRHILSRDLPAVLGALLFAVHPIQAEVVNWATNLFTALTGAAVMCSVWLYLLATDPSLGPAKPARRRALLWAATGAFVVALLSKPAVVVTPLIVLVLLVAIRRATLANLVPLLGWAALCVPIAIVVNRTQATAQLPVIPPLLCPLVAADTLAFQLLHVVFPAGLAVDYGRSPNWLIHSSAIRWTWIVAVLVAALAAIAARTGWRLAAAGIVLFAVGLLPCLGLLPFEFQMYSTAADRYCYLAMLGPALVLSDVARRWPRAATPVLIAALMCLSALSVMQSRHWRDTRSLMDRALAVNPRSRLANRVLGYQAARQQRPDEARAYYQRVLDLDPDDAPTNFNLGNLLLSQGDPAGAADCYRRSLAGAANNAAARGNLGIALMRLNRPDEAYQQFVQAIQADPTSADAHANLGHFFLAVDQPQRARDEFREALRMDPANASAAGGMKKLDDPNGG